MEIAVLGIPAKVPPAKGTAAEAEIAQVVVHPLEKDQHDPRPPNLDTAEFVIEVVKVSKVEQADG